MSKTKTFKPPYKTRTETPKMVKDAKGNAVILCPYCVPTHPLNPNQPSLCGTTLRLTAEQTVIRAKFNKKYVCVKCGKGGGEMVIFQNGFIHINDCNPGVMTMTNPPKYSRLAEVVREIKNQKLKSFIERFTGKAMPVEEITSTGQKTGVILGSFFWKPKEKKNGKHSPTPA